MTTMSKVPAIFTTCATNQAEIRVRVTRGMLYVTMDMPMVISARHTMATAHAAKHEVKIVVKIHFNNIFCSYTTSRTNNSELLIPPPFDDNCSEILVAMSGFSVFFTNVALL